MHSHQSIFDTVARAIITQGVPSLDKFGDTCMYRDAGGNKCAAGHLIPDEEYDPSMEAIQASWVGGHPPAEPRGKYDGPVSQTLDQIIVATGAQFINGLQSIHDDAAAGDFLKEFRVGMIFFATTYGLNSEALHA